MKCWRERRQRKSEIRGGWVYTPPRICAHFCVIAHNPQLLPQSVLTGQVIYPLSPSLLLIPQ